MPRKPRGIFYVFFCVRARKFQFAFDLMFSSSISCQERGEKPVSEIKDDLSNTE
jgi:hypothetical protein